MINALLVLALVGGTETSNRVYVAPDADASTAKGSLEHPFTLAQAVLGDSREVVLRGGDYFVSEPLALKGQSISERVVYRSYPGERARILGGIELPESSFAPVNGSMHLLAAELGPLGVTDTQSMGGDAMSLKAELFEEDGDGGFRPLQLARSPNVLPNDLWQWVGFDNVSEAAPDGSWFVLRDTEAVENGRWLDAVASEDGLQLLGHWGQQFGFDCVKVASIKPISLSRGASAGTIVRALAYNISLGAGKRTITPRACHFVAIGALALIDSPGEYWIDKSRLRLYLSAQSHAVTRGPARKRFLSIGPRLTPQSSFKNPRGLVELSGATAISLINLTIAVSTQSLLIADGADGVIIDGCTFSAGACSARKRAANARACTVRAHSNFRARASFQGDCLLIASLFLSRARLIPRTPLTAGADGVALRGKRSTLRHSEIGQVGAQALELTGGNLDGGRHWNTFGADLFVSASLEVLGSTLHHWARWQRVPQYPGLTWTGVGHRVHGNIFRDAPTPAVQAGGNVDCVFESNLIENVNYEQIDMGAYYHGSSAGGYEYAWTQPGNAVRNNTWRTIRYRERRGKADERFSTSAVYLDDEMSQYTVEANTFSGVDLGVLVGGGKYHRVINNRFEGCDTACIHIDNRGMNWAHELCGCRCAFDRCDPGCFRGAQLGPGLAQNLTAAEGTFRFEQGVRRLRCVGTDAAPPCATRPELAWLRSFRSDATGGGACSPSHNIFSGNRFDRASVASPWQLCGDLHNASRFHHACQLAADPNLGGQLTIWGSSAVDNQFDDLLGASAETRTEQRAEPRVPRRAAAELSPPLPVMPWPAVDETSPVAFTPWIVNWDIGYYGNASQLQAAIDRSDPDIFEWDFGTENNRQHELTRRGILVSTHQSYEWQQTSGAADHNAFFRRNFLGNGYAHDVSGALEPLHPDRGNLSNFMNQLAPKWHAATKEGNVRAVSYGQSVTQDNVGNYYGAFHSGLRAEPSTIYRVDGVDGVDGRSLVD